MMMMMCAKMCASHGGVRAGAHTCTADVIQSLVGSASSGCQVSLAGNHLLSSISICLNVVIVALCIIEFHGWQRWRMLLCQKHALCTVLVSYVVRCGGLTLDRPLLAMRLMASNGWLVFAATRLGCYTTGTSPAWGANDKRAMFLKCNNQNVTGLWAKQ
jgi:hypothetical protein